MIEKTAYIGYIRDLVFLLRETGACAHLEKEKTASAFHEGREMAFREVLAWMQHQADAFQLPKEELGLYGLDPFVDSLDPPCSKPP